MARSVATPQRRARRTVIPPTATLAVWRLRQTWRLLLLAGLGTIAAVLLVCIVPLFTQVALEAGLRDVLASATGAAQIDVTMYSQQPSAGLARQAQTRLDAIVPTELGPYSTGTSEFHATFDGLQIVPPSTSTGASSSSKDSGAQGAILIGSDPALLARHLQVLQGRLPAAGATTLEVALSQPDAATLHVAPGDTLTVTVEGQQPVQVQLPVVGVYAPTSYVDSIGPDRQYGGVKGGFYSGPGGPGHVNTLLASNDTLLTMLGTATQNIGQGPPVQLIWSYPLDVSHVKSDSVNDLVARIGQMQTDVPGQLSAINGIQGGYVQSAIYSALMSFRIQVILLQIPVALLLLQVFGLILLFVRLMAEMLVDRQADAISLLRSRGASRRHVFGAFNVQNLGLCLLAVILGPLAAIPLVRTLASAALPSSSQSALDAISGSPFAVAWGLKWWVLVAVAVTGFAMILSTNRAAGRNVLSLRRESARTTAKPFWQRLNLDLIFGAFAAVAYVAYTFAVRNVDPRISTALSPLSLIILLFLLVALVLLFARFLPSLVGLGARLATRGRGASAMLALTQIARAPKQPVRMTILLALSTGFTIFALVFGASQTQRVAEVTDFRAGADFTGSVPATVTDGATLAQTTQKYRQIAGVTSASLGYIYQFDPNSDPGNVPFQLFAFDADTFASTARWSDVESPQPLSRLMDELRSRRSLATTQNTVPAILDDATWQAFHLSPGAPFTISIPGTQSSLRFVAVDRVTHIPTVYDSYRGGSMVNSGGILVDYTSFATAYAATVASKAPAPDTVWLRTRDDSSSLASVRQALSTGPLALSNVVDRQQLLDAARGSPLQIDLTNTLLIGAGTALVLALVGIWAGSWLTARSRIVNFAVLRAVGTTPRQLRGMLVWEQAIIYASSLVLGAGVGFLLSLNALPLLVFADLVTHSDVSNTLLGIPQAHVVVPGSTLAAACGSLVVICVLALAITLLAASRLSLGETLRLNED